jgi:hypothetical protein
MFIAARVG